MDQNSAVRFRRAIFGSTNPFCQIFLKRVGVTENVWRPKIGDSHPAQRRRARHGWRLTSGRCLSLHLVCSVQTRWGQNDAGGNGKMSGGGWGNCGCGWVIMGKTQFWEEKNVVSFQPPPMILTCEANDFHIQTLRLDPCKIVFVTGIF